MRRPPPSFPRVPDYAVDRATSKASPAVPRNTTAAGAMYVLSVAEVLLATWPSMRLCDLDPDFENDSLGRYSMSIYGFGVLTLSALA